MKTAIQISLSHRKMKLQLAKTPNISAPPLEMIFAQLLSRMLRKNPNYNLQLLINFSSAAQKFASLIQSLSTIKTTNNQSKVRKNPLSSDSTLFIQNDYMDQVEEFTFTTGADISEYLLLSVKLFNTYDIDSSLQLYLNTGEKSPTSSSSDFIGNLMQNGQAILLSKELNTLLPNQRYTGK